MASYVIISPNPEDDVNGYMERWAINSGLKADYPDAKLIGWDFPFVSPEQQNRFGMHGYVHVDGVTKVDAFSQFN